ncbi:MAG: hypothetical protein HDT43_01085 [Ruminococcaceae bacterium]|nr:hypothetical protein [Oscillospiraceae bacterium]
MSSFDSGSLSDVSDNNRDYLKENFPTYEEIQVKYPNKTVLVLAIEETGYDRHAPFQTDKVNEYLDEQGCDFAVCFKNINCEYPPLHPATKPAPLLIEINNLLDSGEPIDIMAPLAYDEYVFNGLYEPLDEYLETEIGRELYNTLPEKMWDSLRINGSIYGLSGDMEIALSPDRGYYVNAELAEKYGYDVTKPILEQLDILRAVKENEKETDVFAAYANIEDIVNIVNVRMLSSSVYWNGETHSAELSIDNPKYIEYIRLLDTLKKEDLLTNLWNGHSDSFFVWSDTAFGGGIVYENMKPVEVDYGNTVTAIPVFTTKTSVRHTLWATGICSKSEHKEKTFELLARIYTDPVLNNLLVYGIEGEQYTLENGVVKEIENLGDNMFNINPYNFYRFANQMICHRSPDVLFTTEQYAEIFEKAELFGDVDFVLDPTGIIDDLNAEYIAADKLKLPKKGENLDDILAEYRESLYAAGVQKIIDECNRQYEVYKNEKN